MQPADSKRKRERVRDGREDSRLAVERDVQRARNARGVRAGVDALLARLVRRDLRQVEHVAGVEAVPGDFDPRETVDREVAERMRLRGDRCQQRKCQRENDHELPHERAPFRATCAHRMEKRGLRASARR